MIGKRFLITGMRIEIVSDEGGKWQVRNLTTHQTLLFDKKTLDQAIRMGKAEEISSETDHGDKDEE